MRFRSPSGRDKAPPVPWLAPVRGRGSWLPADTAALPLRLFPAGIRSPYHDSAAPAPLVLLRRIDAAQIRSVRQTLFTRHQNVFSDTPQQTGARGCRLLPHFESENAAVRQTQHALAETGQYG